MIKTKITLIAISLFVLSSFSIFSQNPNIQLPKTIGIYGGLNPNMQTPSFLYPHGSNNILFDGNSTAIGGHFGFIGFYPINETFAFSGRIGYNNLSGSFEKTQSFLDTSSNFNLEASIASLEI